MGPRTGSRMKPMRADAGPLVRGLCDQLAIASVINQMVPWDAQRCKLSPGELITVLIICCFLRQRPLYKVFLAFEETDCELLVGRGVVPDDLKAAEGGFPERSRRLSPGVTARTGA
jgi:hypothetical protein